MTERDGEVTDGHVRGSVVSAEVLGAGGRERPPRPAAVPEGIPGRLELGPEGREQKSFSVLPTRYG